MCGRYALGIRAFYVRHQLQQQGLQVDEAPEDDDVRETYNFPPGSYGLVYRADVPDHGVQEDAANPTESEVGRSPVDSVSNAEESEFNEHNEEQPAKRKEYRYQLKAMKWGLIPFWTKRAPEYGSMMRTINCRDDSLIENLGMWTSMKQKKRCIVVCQGFYEWLKKGPGGKEKIPHFVKRKDGQLMCFAGLWDCVQYEDSQEKLYTYTIITTDSNKQLTFLHDRMPVILDAGSDKMKTWLNPETTKWSKELQSLLIPYQGELECYPVSKEVGKVGNNSPDFIIPIDSKENKKNIANFFDNAKKATTEKPKVQVEHEPEEQRLTKDHESTEDNAPLPVPEKKGVPTSLKRAHSPDEEDTSKAIKLESPGKDKTVAKKARSATKNQPLGKKDSPTKKADGTQRITNFFVK